MEQIKTQQKKKSIAFNTKMLLTHKPNYSMRSNSLRVFFFSFTLFIEHPKQIILHRQLDILE